MQFVLYLLNDNIIILPFLLTVTLYGYLDSEVLTSTCIAPLLLLHLYLYHLLVLHLTLFYIRETCEYLTLRTVCRIARLLLECVMTMSC